MYGGTVARDGCIWNWRKEGVLSYVSSVMLLVMVVWWNWRKEGMLSDVSSVMLLVMVVWGTGVKKACCLMCPEPGIPSSCISDDIISSFHRLALPLSQ